MSEMPIFEAMNNEDALTIDEIMAEELVAANPIPWAIEWSGKARKKRSTFHSKQSRGTEVRLRFSVYLGMLSIERAWKTTCEWRSPFCTKHCYNKGGQQPEAGRGRTGLLDEAFWEVLDGAWLHELLHSDYFAAFCEKMGQTPSFMRARMRIASKGEAFETPEDVAKIADLCEQNPSTTFWIPTRAWWDAKMAALIDRHVRSLPNARVLASADPSYTVEEFNRLEQLGWNMMFFGDDALDWDMFLCPKTWEPIHSYCRNCQDGCFSRGNVDIHLKTHTIKVKDNEYRRYGWVPGVGPGR